MLPHPKVLISASLATSSSSNLYRDVLRRHERTCKSRGLGDTTRVEPDWNLSAKHSSSSSNEIESLASLLQRTDNSDLETFGESSSKRLCKENDAPRQAGDMGSFFDPSVPMCDMLNESLGMTYQLEFSELDSLLFPSVTADILIAERLEHMVFFTSSRGMASFTDRDTFQWKQKLTCEAYDQKTKRIGLDIPAQTFDSLSSKSQEVIDSLKAVICKKRNDDIIKLDWTHATLEICLHLFSPPNIHRFLEYFWSLWYPHCPIVHRPLFDATSALSPLLCVMVIIGACLSPDTHDGQAAKKCLDSVEELIFGHEIFRCDAEPPNNREHSKKEKTQYIQAAYLVSTLQKREGSVEAQARIRRYRHASMVALARHIGPSEASHRNLHLEEATQSWWQTFAEEEELIRTLIFVFLIDVALIVLHNSPPRMLISELRMDVACPEACFQAESAAECLGSLRVWAGTRFWKKKLSIVSVVRRICQSPIKDGLVQEFSQLGTLNLFTVVQAIHSLMFHLHNSLVFESTLTPVQIGLENWRQVWIERVPEDEGMPGTAQNLWKQVGFLRRASEFWHLARIMADKIMSTSQDDDFEVNTKLSKYDQTDMGDVNGMIKEYRMLNLGVQ
ncbi:hypothetical protein N7520_000274 [Penicillium odoratum]|uniref:uncharacterized protein n=1 Tax=Penicillium odoratum TaxID=1167516 RepID=UPI0025485523|nr:uncharacterized protein N7520_000274 [Penicillium odoratum]KAJ5777028.1 hypothetical protein N7520_000274 [Penicillium odoratum]